MKRIIVSLSFILLVGLLSACGGGEKEVTDKEVGSVESTNKGETPESTEEKAEENDVQTFDQEIVDNEQIKATLISVEHIKDKTWDEERIQVKFEVENKGDTTVAVQAREVSADGKMLDESLLSMSQDVSAGKRADAILDIQNYDGDLPVIEEDLEMILHIFSWDDMDYEQDHLVKIEFN